MKMYRSIYLISQLFSTVCANLIALIQAVALVMCTLSLYFTFGSKITPFERTLGFLFFVASGIYTTYMIYALGQVYVDTGYLLESWKRHYIGSPDRKRDLYWEIERRVVRSLQRQKMYAGEAYFLDQRSVLVFWEQVLDKTILLFSL